MNLDSIQIGNYLYLLTTWTGVLILVFWISLVIWTIRDMRARSASSLWRFLAACLVLFFFLPGLLIYLILRPRRTLEEDFQMTLEEEALLQSIEETPSCPGCGRKVREDWIVCPGCHTKLRKICPSCNRLLELPWNICPFCAQPTSQTVDENIIQDQDISISELELDKELHNFDIINQESHGSSETEHHLP